MILTYTKGEIRTATDEQIRAWLELARRLCLEVEAEFGRRQNRCPWCHRGGFTVSVLKIHVKGCSAAPRPRWKQRAERAAQ